MPTIRVDMTKLSGLTRQERDAVAAFLFERRQRGSFRKNRSYRYSGSDTQTWTITFAQDFEFIPSQWTPGQFKCLLLKDVPLASGTFASVCEAVTQIVMEPDPTRSLKHRFKAPERCSLAIKFFDLSKYDDYASCCREAQNEARMMGMLHAVEFPPVAPQDHRLPPRIIMPRFAGEDLDCLSRDRAVKFTERQKFEISMSAMVKLMFIHQWMMHGDVSSPNMICDLMTREIRFGDFAFSALNENARAHLRGAVLCLAPELLDDQPFENPSAIDAYALGVVIAELFKTHRACRASVVSLLARAYVKAMKANWANYSTKHSIKKTFSEYVSSGKIPSDDHLLTYLRKTLFLESDDDVYVWNHPQPPTARQEYVTKLSKAAGVESGKNAHQIYKILEIGYTAQAVDPADEPRTKITEAIMGLVDHSARNRWPIHRALKSFIEVYAERFNEQECARFIQSLQNQLLLAATDVAIQRLKAEIYLKPFADYPVEERPKIEALRTILFALEAVKQRPTDLALYDNLVACFTGNEEVVNTLSGNRHPVTQAVNLCSKALFFTHGLKTNKLSQAQRGLMHPHRFTVAKEALQIIQDANAMGEAIAELAPESRSDNQPRP